LRFFPRRRDQRDLISFSSFFVQIFWHESSPDLFEAQASCLPLGGVKVSLPANTLITSKEA
jgi:hypothetical protein